MDAVSMKLSEDEVFKLLIAHLESQGRYIGEKFCLGQKHGIDIEAYFRINPDICNSHIRMTHHKVIRC